MTLQEAYVRGLEDGIRAYSNARDGTYPPQPNMIREHDEARA